MCGDVRSIQYDCLGIVYKLVGYRHIAQATYSRLTRFIIVLTSGTSSTKAVIKLLFADLIPETTYKTYILAPDLALLELPVRYHQLGEKILK
jgi:hypothetical protein